LAGCGPRTVCDGHLMAANIFVVQPSARLDVGSRVAFEAESDGAERSGECIKSWTSCVYCFAG